MEPQPTMDTGDMGLSGSPGLTVALRLTDPEVVSEVANRPEGSFREQFVLAAIRIGVIALRNANGQVDAAAVQRAGDRLIADIRELLSYRATEMTNQMAAALAQYFDPEAGSVSSRLASLTQRDGELDRFLDDRIGAEDSLLAKTLSSQLGEQSPIFRLLSPTDSAGLRAQIEGVIRAALSDQALQMKREFSLDTKDSALSRLIQELESHAEELRADVHTNVAELVSEFSLDRSDSALSRLVSRVEAAQKTIADQFSTDNPTSVINRLSDSIATTNSELVRNLTLDSEDSALARLRRELAAITTDLAAKNESFHSEVRASLASLHARRAEEARSTRHGGSFEEALGELLSLESQRLGDVHTPTGSNVGAIKNCKVGDHVIELGPESAAPGARIVWEAKADKSCDLKRGLSELSEARKNRSAQVGVLVFSRETAPRGITTFSRYGSDIVVVWDAADVGADLAVRAALSTARALVVRETQHLAETDDALIDLENSVRAIEKQVGYLDQVKTWAETIQTNGTKIAERVAKMRAEVDTELQKLDRVTRTLRISESGS